MMEGSSPILVPSPLGRDKVRVFPHEWKVPISLKDFSTIASKRDVELEYRILRVLTENSKMIGRLYIRKSTSPDSPSKQQRIESSSTSKKDRYRDILPFVENRVTLSDGQYINASYMPNFTGSNHRAFIACQGPLHSTIGDQWEMIWAEKVKAVFAIGKLYEGKTEKFAQYWPSSDTVRQMHAGTQFQLELVSEEKVDELIVRRLVHVTRIGATGPSQKQSVIVYHFTDWPDHTAIESRDLLSLVKRMHMFRTSFPENPVVVHCSAGVGRTGCALTMTHVIEAIEGALGTEPHLAISDSSLSILTTAINLRRYRLYMMQTTDQYISVFRTTGFLLDDYARRQNHQYPHRETPSLIPDLPVDELRY